MSELTTINYCYLKLYIPIGLVYSSSLLFSSSASSDDMIIPPLIRQDAFELPNNISLDTWLTSNESAAQIPHNRDILHNDDTEHILLDWSNSMDNSTTDNLLIRSNENYLLNCNEFSLDSNNLWLDLTASYSLLPYRELSYRSYSRELLLLSSLHPYIRYWTKP